MSMNQVLIDDTDPSILYSGPWFTVQNTQNNTGAFGPPFRETLHGVNASASFSYAFNGMSRWLACFMTCPQSMAVFSGSQVIVLGTSITTNASGTQDPTWQCYVDNVLIPGFISAGANMENNWNFCQSDLQDGHHMLSVDVTVLHQQNFWFDQIQYIPSANVSLDNATVKFDSSSPAVRYSSGWTESASIFVNLTQTAGSTVTFNFTGP